VAHQEVDDLAGLRMTVELRFLEYRGAVDDDLESSAARRN
jgi:hypothetical protein